MPTTELADLLERMAHGVRTGDSLEGFLEYSLPDPDDNDPGWRDGEPTTMVRAALRTGNLMGQGSMIMLGTWVEAPTEERA